VAELASDINVERAQAAKTKAEANIADTVALRRASVRLQVAA
jgi:F0F1-type ATP synthase epsilon subunit